MEINEAIKIVDDNFRLNTSDYIKLMGLIQELQQYRKGAGIADDGGTHGRVIK